jgi:hypothetical protein
MKATVKKMYRVFDELHTTKEEANKVLRGWEHKEKVTVVYAVGYELTDHITDLQGIYLAKTEEEAIEEAYEMNN